ncbi:MAG: hypothetical protein FD167_374 [bacterium]|nr:MAG: hypothetical protein FD167_374 [bacterium]
MANSNSLPNIYPINKQVSAMEQANQLALSMIKSAQQQEPNKTDKLFSKCPVCYGSTFLIVYQNGIRGAKRCPNAVWNAEDKKYICHLNNVINGQIANRDNQKDLLKAIRKIVFELKINAVTFPKVIGQFFQVNTLEELTLKQLDLLLAKLKLAQQFQLELIENNQIPQQKFSLKRAISKVA